MPINDECEVEPGSRYGGSPLSYPIYYPETQSRMTPTNCSGGLFPASQMIMPRKNISAPSMSLVNEYPKSFSCQSLTLVSVGYILPLPLVGSALFNRSTAMLILLFSKLRDYSYFHEMQTIFNRNHRGGDLDSFPSVA